MFSLLNVQMQETMIGEGFEKFVLKKRHKICTYIRMIMFDDGFEWIIKCIIV